MPGERRRAHFTRGEKCIFVHVVGSFALLLALVLAYFVHLCVVRHKAGEMFKIARRSEPGAGALAVAGAGARRVGVAWVRGARACCGCVLVRRRWSVAPAHCVAARADPAMARQLPAWALRYQRHGNAQDTAIIRSVVHSHFNKDDYQNNIGLFEHADSIAMEGLLWSDGVVDDDFLQRHAGRLAVLGWQTTAPEARAPDFSARAPAAPEPGSVAAAEVTPLGTARCQLAVSALAAEADVGAKAGAAAAPRAYELCALLHPGATLLPDYGATLVVDSKVLGFFAWGDTHGDVPLVMINLAHFTDWINRIVYD